MPRLARVIVPGVPYHLTQRGNSQQDVFFKRAAARSAKGKMHAMRMLASRNGAFCAVVASGRLAGGGLPRTGGGENYGARP